MRSSPALSLLNILGIALGVAVFLSIQIANESSLRAFRDTIDVVAGRSQLEVVSDSGRFKESLFASVARVEGVAALTPTVEQICAVIKEEHGGPPTTYLRILGIDLFSNAPFRPLNFGQSASSSEEGLSPSALEKFFKNPNTICITTTLADKEGLRVGDSIELLVGQEIVPLIIAATFTPDKNAPGADEHLAIMDIGHAQELFNSVGYINRIDIRVSDELQGGKLRDALEELEDEITPLLFPDTMIQSPGRRGSKVEKMLWAFQLNLTALSLLSLVVGMFLIYNSMTTSVVRRRKEIGILRASGMSAGEVQCLFLCEAGVQGLIGVAAGCVLGFFISGVLTAAVAQTIQSLYLTMSVATVAAPLSLYLIASLAGMIAVLLSAWLPAREAAQINPVESFQGGTLHQKMSLESGYFFQWGLGICILSGLCALGALYLYAPLGFVSALTLTLGIAFFVPLLLQKFCGGLALIALRGGSFLMVLAARQIARALNRTSVAVAALMAALAMMVGVSIMIHSFRVTVDSWIVQTIRADLLISPASQLLIGPGATLSPEMVTALRSDPDVALVDTYAEKRISYENDLIKVAGIAMTQLPAQKNLHLLDSTPEKVSAKVARRGSNAVIVSDVFARKFHVKPGEKITIQVGQDEYTLEVISRYRDYTTELGVIMMDQSLMKKIWGRYEPQSLGVYLHDPSMIEALRTRIIAQFAPRGELLIFSNRELKSKILDIFDQTFAVTYILRTIALIIAGLGIFQTLTVLVTERTRELGILRAVGLSRGELKRLIFFEAGIMGFASGALGIAAGIILSLILCYVINLSFFRWTIEWSLPVGLLLWTLPAVMMVSCLAAWTPARRAARLKIVKCIQNE